MAARFTSTQLLLIVCLFLNVPFSSGKICTDDVCEYTFVVRKARSMTYSTGKKSYNVALNGTDLQVIENSYRKKSDDNFIGSIVSRDDVITADGYTRNLITINDKFPGPNIEVMQGSQVVVNVENKLTLEGLTFHWHGIQMRDTPWMDGAAYITQCPLLPNQRFTYRFKAEPAGSHWYHSHFHSQRMDGLFGMLIIHKELPRLPTFAVTLIDWLHVDTSAIAVQDPSSERPGTAEYETHGLDTDYMLESRSLTTLKFKSILINGRGRYEDQLHPLEEFNVNPGQRYRFYLVNAGHAGGFEVSIDNHKLIVVGTESSDLVHFTVDSLLIHAAESYVVEVQTTEQTGKFWFRARTLRVGVGSYPVADGIVQEGRAILSNGGGQTAGEPTSTRKVCSKQTPCDAFNCPFKQYPTVSGVNCIPVTDARTQMAQEALTTAYGLDTDDADVVEIFLNFAFSAGSSINARKYVRPRAPMFNSNIEQYITPCDTQECDSSGCECTHTVDIPANRTIQLVLTSFNLGSDFTKPHPVHVHGHNFAVLKMGFAEQNKTTGFASGDNPDILCAGPNPELCARPQWNGGRPLLNRVKPPLKDNIIVPSRGYAVVRFRSDNPGFWLIHCHIEAHMTDGMVMIMNEAAEAHKELPKGFPACGDFTMTDDEYETYTAPKSTNPAPTATEPPRTPPVPTCTPNDEGDGGDRPKGNTVELDVQLAIGVGVGLVILGSIITLLPALIFGCCRRGSKM